jgi:hypothetical protein
MASVVVCFWVFGWGEEKTLRQALVAAGFQIFDVLWRFPSVTQGAKADCGIAELGRRGVCVRARVGWLE